MLQSRWLRRWKKREELLPVLLHASFPNETRVAEQSLLVHYRESAGNVWGDTPPLGAAAEAKPPGSASCPGVTISKRSESSGTTKWSLCRTSAGNESLLAYHSFSSSIERNDSSLNLNSLL